MKYLKLFEEVEWIKHGLQIQEYDSDDLFAPGERDYLSRYTYTVNGIKNETHNTRGTFDEVLKGIIKLKKSFLKLNKIGWVLDNYWILQCGKTPNGFDAYIRFANKDEIDIAIEGQKYNL